MEKKLRSTIFVPAMVVKSKMYDGYTSLITSGSIFEDVESAERHLVYLKSLYENDYDILRSSVARKIIAL